MCSLMNSTTSKPKVSNSTLIKVFSDIIVIFNYLWAMPSIRKGETWTPMCVPGCSEEFMLHVYSNFRSSNLAVIIVCTDNNPTCFDECQQFSNAVFDFLSLP